MYLPWNSFGLFLLLSSISSSTLTTTTTHTPITSTTQSTSTTSTTQTTPTTSTTQSTPTTSTTQSTPTTSTTQTTPTTSTAQSTPTTSTTQTTPIPTTSKPPSNNCGYKSCNPIKEGFINVHIVPHTHDDVGWLKTVDQYYYGSNSRYQQAGVQYILDTVVDSLGKDKNRKFIYVETAFFWKWWIKQHDIVKNRVRNFVRNGQLEFISGGWSMNDEAATNYHSIIDQMTWGLRKLNDTFGECGRPKIGWQIDPFGHSKEMASIFSQLGFDGFLLGRIDYQEKKYRMATKTAEMVWRGSSSLGESSDIFTGVMYNTYSPPPGFCFDILCSDEPFIDDKKSFEYNVDQRVDDFLDYVKNVTEVYATSNIIITMGEDFNYQDAEAWFKNLDKLIYYCNQRQANGSKYNLFYSTPSCYVKAIHDETQNKKEWLLKQDDFFPYASDPHAFWTGYFTSRPTIKRFERIGNNFLQVCKQLYALTDLGPEDRVDLNALREAMGVMQHHDAITGTEKQHVANDYARKLQQGIDECEIITNTALSKLITSSTLTTSKFENAPLPVVGPFTTCALVNISQCAFTEEEKTFVVTVYNPLSRPVSKNIRIPVTGSAYVVKDWAGQKLQTQLIPIADPILNLPGRVSNAKVELIFIASNVPSLGFNSYYVEKTDGDHITRPNMSKLNSFSFGDSGAFIIHPETGLVSAVRINGVTLPLTQNFFYYKGFVGNNDDYRNRSSGAYIFRPIGPALKVTDRASFKVYQGYLVAEVHQTFNDWISQIVRVNLVENLVEFNWLVGPIPSEGPNGIEVVTKYSTDLASDSTFYTDSNGREMLKRIRNVRPTWKVNLQEPISGNYYPVTSKISIRDEPKGIALAVLTDRAQGGTSLDDGEVELMVHRNCLSDDAFGVDEALNETAYGKGLVARGSHYLVVGSINRTQLATGETVVSVEKDIAQRKLLDAWTFLSPTYALTYEQYKAKYVMTYSGLKRALPDNVQILTLEPWKGYSFLLRLEHVFEKNDDPVLSQSVIVKLKDLFSPFQITSVQETTLGANQWLKDNHRFKFDTNGTLEELLYEDYNVINDYDAHPQKLWMQTNIYNNIIKRETVINVEDNIENFEVVLGPMQIRTFVIEISKQ